VGEVDQWRRLEPVLRAALALGCPVVVDTSEPGVMRRALELGADAINDVRALRRPGALAVLAEHGAAGVCLMHMRGEPATMQQQASYDDVAAEVRDFLAARMAAAVAAGIAAERIVLDPGIGFAKSADHSLALLARQAELASLGRPLLVGWSRKSALGAVTGRAVDERVAASVAAAVLAVDRGAAIVRVHDVAATVDALRVWRAGTSPRPGGPQGACDPAVGRTIPH
jgi:dihydropteroate synthase